MSNTPTATPQNKRRLRAHFAVTRIPFSKGMWARQMFDSQSQRELLGALHLWTEARGLALVIGQSGVGKSITLRRFVEELDEARFRVTSFSYLPTTVNGFLRSLARSLGLPMHPYSVDLFDTVQKHLVTSEQEQGPHPVILLDDCEGLTPPVVDTVRRLTCFDLDAEDRFSVLMCGTEQLLGTLKHPGLDTLRSRITYAHILKPFSLDDTRHYIRYQIELAQANPKLFADSATRLIFQASKGRPRNINQLSLQAMITAVMQAKDTIDAKVVETVLDEHPLYHSSPGVEMNER